mmetsp:Transcript_29646/g.84700  ORF Transcript_29646/g.84700 Transcript_29646/m.84700 type:complete len:464 (+) Transcript_29646:85-1476(+)
MSNTAGGPGQEAKKEEDRSVRRTTSARIQVRAHTVLSWSVDSFAALPEEGCSDDDAEGDDVGGLSSWPPVGSAISLKRQCRIDVPPAVARMQSTEPPDGILQQASNFPVELGCPYLRDPSGASAARRGSAPTPTCLERFAEEAKAARWGRRNTGCDEWDDRADTVGAPLERRRISTERLRKRRSTSVPPNWRSSRLEGVVEVEQEEASDRVQKTHSSLTEPVSAHGAAARDGPERAEPSAAGSQSEEEEEEAAEPAPAGFTPDETVIIFDWDDTLLCSSFLRAHVRDEDKGLPKSARPHFRSIEATAVRLLGLAAQRGHCIIVTNAVEGWVEHSAAKYVPGLCEALGAVRIVSARSAHGEQMPGQERQWKAEAFRAVCRQFAGEGRRLNLTVIGDSEMEMGAARAIRQEFEHVLVKTVKLQELPSPEDLSKELAVVSQKFEKILAAPRELSISLARKWPGRTP